MKNIKIGVKLIGGFIAVAAITLIVGGMGWYGAMQLDDAVTEIGVVRLPSIQGLLVIYQAMTEVDSAENALLSTKLSAQERKDQYARFDAAKARADAGWKIYEPLPQTKEEEATWKLFVPAWEKWWKDHLDYVALAKEYERSPSDSAYDKLSQQAIAVNGASFGPTEELLKKLVKINDDVAKDAVEGAGKLADQIRFQTVAYTTAGVVLALALGVLLSLGIAGPLKKASRFAQEVAAGSIDRELAIDQRDEVGQACAALKEIAAVLRTVLAEFGDATRQIGAGRLRARGDAGKFSGAFRDLITDANRMADSLVGYLDMVPNPIMTVDTQYTIQFMNRAGAKVGGADPVRLQGTRCFEHFKTGDCQTPGCACNRAVQAGGGVDSATTAHPGGQDLEIVYSAVPIRDRDGKTVGAMEVVTDQTEIKRAQRKMQRLAQQAESIANSVSSAAEELSAQVEQSSRGAEMQRERATETATAMEEMNSTVMEVAKNASDAAKAADTTQAKAREGARNVDSLVAAVQDIKTQMDALSENMAGLGKQAESISGILNVISDIADQTNLLALNAAIEAARAGDAGRGFAVVADEVRKLAEKTQTATQEVGDAITAIQERARKSVGETKKAAETVSGSAETAKASGRALGEIVALIEQTVDQVRAIATASEQQSAASEEINKSTEEINRISAETSEAMTQSSAAIMELARLAQDLNGLIAEMNA